MDTVADVDMISQNLYTDISNNSKACILQDKETTRVFEAAGHGNRASPTREILVNVTCKGTDFGYHAFIVLDDDKSEILLRIKLTLYSIALGVTELDF